MIASARVFVTDFDGTMAAQDFYRLVAQQYMPLGAPDYWDLYARGKITHFEAMRSFFSHAPEDEEALNRLLQRMDPDPGLGAAVDQLQQRGWQVIVASAGSAWYIDRLLAQAGVSGVEVYANPGSIEPGRGLWIRLPEASPFFSLDVGINKPAIVREALRRAELVAFAGDGPPDLEPALLVRPGLRFARGWLAGELDRRGEPFSRFQRWSDVAEMLAAL